LDFTTAPPKPSVQSQLVMDAMEENEEKIEAKFDKMMDSIDMLFNKMENIHFAQQQKQVKLDINTKAVDQSNREGGCPTDFG
jgi:hypothetical protein